jgi:16S rRNA (cytosine967-C5)-methyltransferase
MAISSARVAAFDILLRVEREDSYASDLLHASPHNRLSNLDHALATELVMGVLRWRSRLDAEIERASSQPLAKLDPEILIALRLALYQFRRLDRVPARAALHESVELVKRARKRSAAAFVNAVLRKLAAAREDRAESEAKSAGDLAAEFAHPLWMVERWIAEYGFGAAQRVCRHDQATPRMSVRLRGKDVEGAAEGIGLRDGAVLSSARWVEAGDVTKTKAFRQGQVVIQDEGSQLVAALAGAGFGSGRRILDCCAAPGGKTLAMADRNPQAEIVALELHPHRARLMGRILQGKTTAGQIRIVAGDARQPPLDEAFDRILADVPCSGTGTLARNPEIKWRLRQEDLAELQKRQAAILKAALAQVAAGGRVIYSTCSLEKEENEDVVEEALAANRGFTVVDCRGELARLKESGELAISDTESLTRGPYLRTIPGVHACDGFFAAIVERG